MGRAFTALLDLVITKPIAAGVWWLSERLNAVDFHARDELHRRLAQARRERRPVLLASNHVSMFDDPVLPMALWRTGRRAALELGVLTGLVGLWWFAAGRLPPSPWPAAATLGWGVGIALFGARKTWWSLGDLLNFSSADALRGRLQSGGERRLSLLQRVLLRLADPTIFLFMRSAVVKTILVDRRPGELAQRARDQAVARTIEVAARGEPVWIFFEGGRARDPDRIGPARTGVGQVVRGLHDRALRPRVFAVHHRGLERVLPRGSRRWISTGHRIEVRWSECSLEPRDGAPAASGDAQSLADAVRAEVVRLQLAWRAGGASDA